LPFEEFFFNSCNFGHFVYGVGEYHASSTFTILLEIGPILTEMYLKISSAITGPV
jgi:hypothetical protein